MRVLSLYIHVPFCTRRCSYCSFFHLGRDRERELAYVDALEAEIAATLGALDDVRLGTVFVGGGTPSVLGEESLARVFAAFAPWVDGRATREVTCELNPEDVTPALLTFLAARGVDRVSLGVQSMDADAQRRLKRCTPETNARAIDMVMERFSNVSFDVLLGVPGGSVALARRTLETLVAYGPTHFSVYCLEPGGDMGHEVEDFFAAVDPERPADEYLETCALLGGHGYRHYEVSNFARPGFESAHNRVYWEGGEYLGVGPGAHSCLDGRRFSNAPDLADYLRHRGAARSGARILDADAGEHAGLERAMLALRTSGGMALSQVRGGAATARDLVDEGLARIVGERLVLTDRGFLLMNDIVLRVHRSGPDTERAC